MFSAFTGCPSGSTRVGAVPFTAFQTLAKTCSLKPTPVLCTGLNLESLRYLKSWL